MTMAQKNSSFGKNLTIGFSVTFVVQLRLKGDMETNTQEQANEKKKVQQIHLFQNWPFTSSNSLLGSTCCSSDLTETQQEKNTVQRTCNKE